MSAPMRAKLRIGVVIQNGGSETLHFHAVCANQ